MAVIGEIYWKKKGWGGFFLREPSGILIGEGRGMEGGIKGKKKSLSGLSEVWQNAQIDGRMQKERFL